MRRLYLPALSVLAVVYARTAMADATVSVGDPGRFAPPPAPYRPPVMVVDPPPPPVDEPVPEAPPRERYRAPFRLSVGPAAFTSGQGLGMGLGVAADFGTGTVGARLAAAWLRGETSKPFPRLPWSAVLTLRYATAWVNVLLFMGCPPCVKESIRPFRVFYKPSEK